MGRLDKYGRTMDAVKNIQIVQTYDNIPEYNGNSGSGYPAFNFKDKTLANMFLEQIHEKQRQKLNAFNEKFGTAYEYPYDVVINT